MIKTYLGILAGLGGMLGWGSADFFAGSTTRDIGFRKTFFWVHLFGLLVNLFLLSINLPESLQFNPQYFGLTFIASLAYLFGYLFLYKSFAKGNLSIVSPVNSTYAVFSVLIAIFLFQQTLSRLQLPGIMLVIVGIMLLSLDFTKFKTSKISLTKGVKEAFLSAVLFGALFWPLNEYITERTSWIFFNVLVKLISVVLFGSFMILKNRKESLTKIPAKLWPTLAFVGILDVIGVLSVGYGIAKADSVLVVPISSAYGLTTAILAIIFLKEKVSPLQKLAIFIVVTGIIMTGV